jgi:hypothetical protein
MQYTKGPADARAGSTRPEAFWLATMASAAGAAGWEPTHSGKVGVLPRSEFSVTLQVGR